MIGSVCRGGVGQYRPKAIDCPEKGGLDEKAEDAGRCVASGRFRAYHGPISRLLSFVFNGRRLSEPTTLTFGDGLWFSFETVSTIGFGDIPAETPVARAITVVLSVISIFYIAMLTGVAVSYCNTLIKMRQKDTMARFMDDLERLEELDRDELADLSRRVREYRRRQR